jgi:hypothetical protein
MSSGLGSHPGRPHPTEGRGGRGGQKAWLHLSGLCFPQIQQAMGNAAPCSQTVTPAPQEPMSGELLLSLEDGEAISMGQGKGHTHNRHRDIPGWTALLHDPLCGL